MWFFPGANTSYFIASRRKRLSSSLTRFCSSFCSSSLSVCASDDLRCVWFGLSHPALIKSASFFWMEWSIGSSSQIKSSVFICPPALYVALNWCTEINFSRLKSKMLLTGFLQAVSVELHTKGSLYSALLPVDPHCTMHLCMHLDLTLLSFIFHATLLHWFRIWLISV